MNQVKKYAAPKSPAEHFIHTQQQAALLEVIKRSPLATLLYLDNDTELHISHIPFHFSNITLTNSKSNQYEELIGHELIAHVSNKHVLSQQLKTTKNNMNAPKITLIFHGEDDYISPNDVSSEHSSMQKVPTWNYAKVHISGHVTEITDSDEKHQQMAISTDYFEQIKVDQALTSPEKNIPWSLAPLSTISNNSKLTSDDIAIKQMLKAITIFKLTINSIEGHFKLSQNKPKALKAQIAEQVARRKKNELAKQISAL